MKQFFFLLLMTLPLSTMAGNTDSLQIRDTACNRNELFEMVEQMPAYTGGIETLKKQLNKTILTGDTVNGTLVLMVKINCRGRIFGADVKRSVNSTIDQKVIEGLLKYQDWMPGKQNGHPIDCRIQLHFIITNGRINV